MEKRKLHEELIWTGNLRFGEVVVPSVDMFALFRDAMMPYLLGSTLNVQEVVSWWNCMELEPIRELVSSTELCGRLTDKYVVDLHIRKENNIQHFQASYYKFMQRRSEEFCEVHAALRRSQLTGLCVLPSGVLLLLIPNGELSSLLALPNSPECPMLHCVALKLMSETGVDIYEGNQSSIKKLEPIDTDLFDTRPSILAAVAEFNAIWANELHARSESPSDASRTKLTYNKKSHPQLRQIPDSSSSLEADRIKKQILFQQTMERVKNFGKEQTNTNGFGGNIAATNTASNRPSSSLGPTAPTLLSALRDPRLKRSDPRSAAKILGPDAPLPTTIANFADSAPLTSTSNNFPTDLAANSSAGLYSPTQPTMSMSPVSMDISDEQLSIDTNINDNDGDADGAPASPATDAVIFETTKKIPQIPLERRAEDEDETEATTTIPIAPVSLQQHFTPDKFFGDISSILNDSINRFNLGFATSTPNPADRKNEPVPGGLKFDILGFNSKARKLVVPSPIVKTKEPPPIVGKKSDVKPIDSTSTDNSTPRAIKHDKDTTLIAPANTELIDDEDEDDRLRIADDDESEER